jgi:hypothetical protein
MSAPAPISPDGAFWWDGQSWQPIPHEGPIPPPGVHVVEPAAVPWATPASTAVAKTRPPYSTTSWLPDDTDIPAAAPARKALKRYDTVPPGSTVPPIWRAKKRRVRVTRVLSTVAIVVLVLLAVGSGAWAVQRYGIPSLSVLTASHKSQVTPSPVVTPSPHIIEPLTATITGVSCPVAHVGDPACWKVSFTNTGPAIGNLAMVFVTDPPYSNWFQHHLGATMQATDNAAGCAVEDVHVQVVCGAVPAGAHITIHLIAYIANAGAHTYGVRFGDIASGAFVDVDLASDGTPFVASWKETIS